MQILDERQINYCNVVVEKECLLGMSFQDKIYLRNKLYSLTDKLNAIEYCKQKYLDAKGSKSYALVKNATGFAVWVENKSAKILGQKDPLEVIYNLDLKDLVSKIRSVRGIKIQDRDSMNVYERYTTGKEVNECLIDSLELSIEQAINLGQKLMDDK